MEFVVRLHSAAKEPETVTWIETFEPGDVFFDIGANVGAYSLIAALAHEGQVRVCAFEPSALNYCQLVRNLALNHTGDVVIPLPIPLGAMTKVDVFHYRSAQKGAALHAVGEAVSQDGVPFVPALSQRILVHSLDDAVAMYELPHPNHIKLDVDGPELAILHGAGKVLSAPELRTVLIEESPTPSTNQAIVAVMATHGFTALARHVLQEDAVNVLFARSVDHSGPRA